MPAGLNLNLDYGWFSIPDDGTIFIYIKDIKNNPRDDLPAVLDAIFQLVHILGQTLPSGVDIWVDLDNVAPQAKCRLKPIPLVDDHPIDQMHKYIGPVAREYFPLAKLILYTYAHLKSIK